MRPFGYVRATDPAAAVALVDEHPAARFLAGGTNLVDHLKLGLAEPDLLVDIRSLPFDAVEETGNGGVRIGTNVLNSTLAAHPLIRRRYPMLSRSLLAGASPQLRNLATTGGNLLQRTRCVYFQDLSTPCNKREPGTGCSAVGGYTRYHAILGGSDHCRATHPSDMAVALTALDADVLVLGPRDERRIALVDLHRLPGEEPERDTVLDHAELIVAIEIPPPPSPSVSAYRKVRDRASYAFALVSVAAELQIDGNTITAARMALGGVAHKPWRADRAERALVGAPATEHACAAAADAELAPADPMAGNEFKVELARRTMSAVLRDLIAEARS